MAANVRSDKIGIVGSGVIGRNWAMIFASAGYSVTIFDIEPSQVSNALSAIKSQMEELAQSGLLRGKLTVAEQFALIAGSNSIAEALAGASFVQECVFENLEVKQKVFSQMEECVGDDAILSSSSSCIMPSRFTESLKRRNQCLVSHPVNPPYYAPLVEIVPAPWTDQTVIDRTRAIMESVGQVPVTLKREVPGFAINRMQYALIAESWKLVEGGVLSADDVDKVMTAGLGMRYAFMGPLEVVHLNAEGTKDYMERYAQGMHHVMADYGPTPSFGGPGLDQVAAEMTAKIPLDRLAERRQWRDSRLAALAKLKRELDEQEKH